MTAQPPNNGGSALVRKIFVYAGVLMGVCMASAAGISTLYVVNRNRIRENEMKSFHQSLAAVLGDAEGAEPMGEKSEEDHAEIYAASLDGKVRYVVRGSARGYQSRITVLAAVDAPAGEPVPEDASIYRVAVVSSGETPGLGENINKVQKDVSLWAAIVRMGNGGAAKRPWFQAQFSGKRLSDLRVVAAGDAGITPITGATITSRATTEAVRRAVNSLIERTEQLYGE